jgi:hypothetical protein
MAEAGVLHGQRILTQGMDIGGFTGKSFTIKD